MSRLLTSFAIATATAITLPSAALAGQDGETWLQGSGIIVGNPIAIHNQLHFRQEADRLHSDYRAALAKDGGHLSPAENAALFARYQSLATRVNRLIAEGDTPTKAPGFKIPRRSSINNAGLVPIPLQLPVAGPSQTR